MISDRRDQLTALIDQGDHIVAHYHALAQQRTLSESDAPKQALGMLAAMRYGKDGYISVNDSQPVMLDAPVQAGTGRQESRAVRRSGGQPSVRRDRQRGNHDGGGFVDYPQSSGTLKIVPLMHGASALGKVLLGAVIAVVGVFVPVVGTYMIALSVSSR